MACYGSTSFLHEVQSYIYHSNDAMKRFITRVQYALQGWSVFFTKETHGQIQLVVAILVVAAGWFFSISTTEWMLLLLCIGLVLALEMVNTAVEKLADRLHPDHHPQIGLVKDVAAGAVLWASLISVVIGLMIFIPYVKALF